MPDYAYTTVPGKLKGLLAKIRETGVPDRATVKWLESIGFKAKNDRTMLPILRQIDLVSERGSPTQRWKDYRGADQAAVLAEGIRAGYADLFAVYPDANTRPTTDLENYFSTKSTAGKQAISKTVGTFKALSELADYQGTTAGRTVAGLPQTSLVTPPQPGLAGSAQAASFSPAVHIDVQIHVSPDTTPEQIDQIFASMAKHLYDIKNRANE